VQQQTAHAVVAVPHIFALGLAAWHVYVAAISWHACRHIALACVTRHGEVLEAIRWKRLDWGWVLNS
jgi:hypothetical protein